MTMRALMVMAKEPSPGETKTRLTPPLSPEEAADLYECLLRDTIEAVRKVVSEMPITPFIAYYPAGAESYFRDLAPEFQLVRQRGQDLSQRLESVLAAVQARGYDQVTAVNSDSPGIPPAYLASAYELLDDQKTDVVFGPSDDGGYYLIGWDRPYPRLLREVTMSTSHVLADTLDVARFEGAGVALLPSWYDVDDASDLERLRQDENAGENTRAFFDR